MQAEFVRKMRLTSQQKNSELALVMAPRLTKMPLPLMYVDDPFLPFSKAVIDATKDVVCAYIFDFPAYLAIGAAGAVALERAIAYAHDEAATILDGRFASLGYAEAAEAFGADAVTVVDMDSMQKYAESIGALLIQLDGSGEIYPTFDINQQGIRIAELEFRVIGEDIVSTHRREDYREQLRATLEQMRNG